MTNGKPALTAFFLGVGLLALPARATDPKPLVLVVTAEANPPRAGLPDQIIPESEYKPTTAGRRYYLTLSPDRQSVSLTRVPGTLIVGKLKKQTNGKDGVIYDYDLTEGTFAGGRLVHFDTHIRPHFDLTIFGAGVPIVSAERAVAEE